MSRQVEHSFAGVLRKYPGISDQRRISDICEILTGQKGWIISEDFALLAEKVAELLSSGSNRKAIIESFHSSRDLSDLLTKVKSHSQSIPDLEDRLVYLTKLIEDMTSSEPIRRAFRAKSKPDRVKEKIYELLLLADYNLDNNSDSYSNYRTVNNLIGKYGLGATLAGASMTYDFSKSISVSGEHDSILGLFSKFTKDMWDLGTFNNVDELYWLMDVDIEAIKAKVEAVRDNPDLNPHQAMLTSKMAIYTGGYPIMSLTVGKFWSIVLEALDRDPIFDIYDKDAIKRLASDTYDHYQDYKKIEQIEDFPIQDINKYLISG